MSTQDILIVARAIKATHGTKLAASYLRLKGYTIDAALEVLSPF